MRLIDADALKESIGECPLNWNDSPEEIQEMFDWNNFMQLIDEAPTISEWVSVKDRMPEDNVPVLVWEQRGFVYVDIYKDGAWGIGTQNLAKPTNWMPLPEPPKKVIE